MHGTYLDNCFSILKLYTFCGLIRSIPKCELQIVKTTKLIKCQEYSLVSNKDESIY